MNVRAPVTTKPSWIDGHRTPLGAGPWLALVLVVGLALAPVTARANLDFRAITDAFDAWDFPGAAELLAHLEAERPDAPELLYLKGELAFYHGDYGEALRLLDAAILTLPADAHYAAALRELVQNTADVTANHVRQRSANGRVEVLHPPGVDALLVPFIFEALDSAYDYLAKELGATPALPIRVEVYGAALDLARVSPLTEDDILNTGTIALCKYNRLMLTTPRVMRRGYAWLDTLVHEYTHMVINIAGAGRVPIWLHEGIAKHSERAWRQQRQPQQLAPYAEWLLHRRASEQRLISFAAMHPSMAKLPTQEDASLAYAEVFAAVELLHQEGSPQILADILRHIAAGTEVEDAVALVYGQPFSVFLSDWEAHLLSRPRRYTLDEAPDVFEQIAFRKEVSRGEVTDIDNIPHDAARQAAHLGDLLLSRQRPRAAAVQYRKASTHLGPDNPVLQTRLGRALLDGGMPQEAVAAMRLATLHADAYVTLSVTLAEAWVALEEWHEALASLVEAIAINPFDPEVHRLRAKTLRALGQDTAAAQAEEHLRLLSGAPSPSSP